MLQFGLLALLLLPSPARAQSEGGPTAPNFNTVWRWADYGPETGFPGGTVREMVQVGDTIWARTDQQILWWAGFEWHESGAAEGLPSGRHTSLAPDGEGGVLAVVEGSLFQGGTGGFAPLYREEMSSRGWVASRAVPYRGGLVVTARGERGGGDAAYWLGPEEVLDYTPAGGLGGVLELWVTSSGAVYLGGARGLMVRETEGWAVVTPGDQPLHRTTTLWEDPKGGGYAFLAASPEGVGLWHWTGGGPAERIPSEGLNAALSGTITPDGVAYVVYETGDVRVLEGGSWRSLDLPSARSHGLHLVFATREGDLWLGSARGLHLFRASLRRWSSIRRPFPDPRNRIGRILPDRNGGTWLGTGDGIMRHSAGGGDAAGSGWISEVLGTRLGTVTGLAQDTTGAIWVTSGASFEGAFVFRDGEWRRFGVEEGLRAGHVHSVEVSRDGSVWFLSLGGSREGTAPGVYRLVDGVVERWEDDRGWLLDPSYAFAEGEDGSYWFGTWQGLCRWENGKWSYWGREEGVGTEFSPRVFNVLPDSSGGAWFGYGPSAGGGIGIAHADGTVSHLTVADGIPGNSVNEINRDSTGVVWISTDDGVGRYQDGAWTVLDGSTGLDPVRTWPIVFSGNTVIFGTIGGGVRILSRGEEDDPAPRVRILGPVSVAGGVARIQWRATAFKGEIASGRVQTRSRFDQGAWGSWSTDREVWAGRAAGLSWGSHTIEIQAKGLQGQISAPVPARFEIPFPLYLRPVFFLPLGGLSLALALVLLAARRRRIRSAFRLRASEQRLRTLVDSAPEAITIYDVDADRFVDSNQNALDMMGLTQGELGNETLADFLPDTQPDGLPSLEKTRSLIRRTLAGEEITQEWVTRRKDGVQIPTEIRLVRFPSEGRRLVRFSLLDIRERKEAERRRAELEEQLRQAQKLEAVGQLTGGVAHDFNNLLTVIIGNLELLQAMKGSDPEVALRVKGCMEAAERSALLTQRLLAFSRRQTLDLGEVRIPEMVGGITDLLVRSLGETIQVRTVFEDGLWTVLADQGQLEHSLINLAVNARDSMAGGGTLTIEGFNEVIEPEIAEAIEAEPGAYVALSVTDTGRGMSPEILSKAFDPFFTTKEVGKGSGLGLSMVYGFARQVGGFVRVDSEVGKGTTVRVFLPKAG